MIRHCLWIQVGTGTGAINRGFSLTYKSWGGGGTINEQFGLKPNRPSWIRHIHGRLFTCKYFITSGSMTPGTTPHSSPPPPSSIFMQFSSWLTDAWEILDPPLIQKVQETFKFSSFSCIVWENMAKLLFWETLDPPLCVFTHNG